MSEYRQRQKYIEEEVDNVVSIRANITEQDYLQLKSNAMLKGLTLQQYFGQVLRKVVTS
jgi:predicted DNA binding CopG/RHH family protein|tara:strand:- start:1262 stop:1438 length:177 start_codon:yes stop_codon:yes gene_type:complete